MGCSTSSDPSVFEKRHWLLYKHLWVTDLVKLIESFIPLDGSAAIPLWYLHKTTTEFCLLKPRYPYAPVVWTYYATRYKGAKLYVLTHKPCKTYIEEQSVSLKLQIFDQYFSDQLAHPKCLKAFKTILKNQPLSPSCYRSIMDHLDFWIYIITCHLLNFSPKKLELEGFFPIVWIMFRYILRSKTTRLKKKYVVNFLIQHPFFCHSIQNNWSNLAGEFLTALSSPSTL